MLCEPIPIENIMQPLKFKVQVSNKICKNIDACQLANERNVGNLYGQDGLRSCEEHFEQSTQERFDSFTNKFRMAVDSSVIKKWSFDAKINYGYGTLVSCITGSLQPLTVEDLVNDPWYDFPIKSAALEQKPGSRWNCMGLKSRETGSAPKIIPDYRECGRIKPNAEFVEYWRDGMPHLFIFLISAVVAGEKICVDRTDMWKYVVKKMLLKSIKLPPFPSNSLDIKNIDADIIKNILNKMSTKDLHRARMTRFHGFNVFTDRETSTIMRNIELYISTDPNYITSRVATQETNVSNLTGNIEIQANISRHNVNDSVLVASNDIEKFHILGKLRGKLCLVAEPCENPEFLCASIRFGGIRIQSECNGPIYALYLYTPADRTNRKLSAAFDYIDMLYGCVHNVGLVEVWDSSMIPSMIMISLCYITNGKPLKILKCADNWWSIHKSMLNRKIPSVNQLSKKLTDQ